MKYGPEKAVHLKRECERLALEIVSLGNQKVSALTELSKLKNETRRQRSIIAEFGNAAASKLHAYQAQLQELLAQGEVLVEVNASLRASSAVIRSELGQAAEVKPPEVSFGEKVLRKLREDLVALNQKRQSEAAAVELLVEKRKETEDALAKLYAEIAAESSRLLVIADGIERGNLENAALGKTLRSLQGKINRIQELQ